VLGAAVLLAALVAGVGLSRAASDGAGIARQLTRRLDTPIMRVELYLAHDARKRPQIVLMTLGGPIYCEQLFNLARNEHASLVCTDYGRNAYEGPGNRAARLEDWGDPLYLDAVAKLPARLRSNGVKIAKLVLVGVSYSGYANAELAATHPELRPDALVIIDSYLDLTARYEALPPQHETTREIDRSLGGTLAQRPAAYAARSPSRHLDGIADEMRNGMRLVDVWSVSPGEQREFRGATCSETANARWLSELATLLGHPVDGYVTQMRHAHALWDRGRRVLALAGIGTADKPLLARRFTFQPRGPIPDSSHRLLSTGARAFFSCGVFGSIKLFLSGCAVAWCADGLIRLQGSGQCNMSGSCIPAGYWNGIGRSSFPCLGSGSATGFGSGRSSGRR
jgi:pimeloyl-ACP methyl ester carboxylesterase